MFKQLQEEHKAWALKNFGEQDVDDYALGLIEEVGELAHSVLKRKQGIRNTEDHDLLIRDAIGDITIYLVGFCSGHGVDLSSFNYPFYYCDVDVKLISKSISNLLDEEERIDRNAKLLIHYLRLFCINAEKFDYEQAVKETWINVVLKRDWVKNPDCIEKAETDDVRYQGFPV